MMNKKLLIIVLLSVIVLVMIVCLVFFISGNQDNSANDKTSTSETKSNGITIEEGAESMAKVAIPAIESYAKQDITESQELRNKRLSDYFAYDSPVFDRDLDIRTSNSATKTEASVKSVEFSEGEGEYPNLIVKVNLTSYYGNDKNTKLQNFWITIKKNVNGKFIANDIGMFDE